MRTRFHSTFLTLVSMVLLAGSTHVARGATIEVPAMQPTIQDGLDAAASGDTVLVAPGTYRGPGNRDLDFAGKGIRLFSTGGAAVTILDAEGGPADPHRGILFDGGEVSVIVDGFRFINGYAASSNGGAVLVDSGALFTSVNLRDCEFFYNRSEDSGGAISVGPNAGLLLIQCTIAGNTASSGGGVAALSAFSLHLTECALTGNLASGGGAMFIDNSSVTGNLLTITANRATNIGGGIFGQANAGAELDYSIIWGNCADVVGNEIYVQISGHSEFNCSDINQSESIFLGTSTVTYGSDVIDQDPLFCGSASCSLPPTLAGDYGLAPASPCLAANNNCGDMGNFNQACSVLGLPDNIAQGSVSSLRAFPNPARGSVRISLASEARWPEGQGTLSVYSVSGRRVRTLALDRGAVMIWDGLGEDGRPAATGLYLLRLVSGGSTVTGRVILER